MVVTLGAVFSISTPTAMAAEEGATPHWSYKGETGPKHWGKLSEKFRACDDGLQQSPINLTAPIPAQLQLVAVRYKTSTYQVVNNGHTIQVNVPPGSSITLGGVSHRLLQFHFHHPSEHVVDGKASPMEIHFVHASASGALAVLGVFVNRGAENETIDQIWSIMPPTPGKRSSSIMISPQDLLPKDKEFRRYFGSLTTPPCSETVTWSVYNKPIEASAEQVARFSALFSNNARPVKPLNRRHLLTSQ